MSFKILDINNNAVAIAELDADAAAFWGKDVHDRQYATPYTPKPNLTMKERFEFHIMNLNWFDKIGWVIHFDKCTTWEQVRIALMGPNMIKEYGYAMVAYTYLPYLSLITYWENNGYTPCPVED